MQSLSSVQERSVSPGNLSKEVAAKTKWVMGATNNTRDILMVRGSSCCDFPYVRSSPLIQLNQLSLFLHFSHEISFWTSEKVELKIQLSCDEYEVQ